VSFISAADRIEIIEVGPRDGLQNESRVLSPDLRVELISRLVKAGLSSIEVGSFVKHDVIPQMAGTAEVFRGTSDLGISQRICLVPNLRGLEDALQAGVRHIAVFVAASESFNLANTNCSIEDGLRNAHDVAEAALEAGINVRGYVSTIAGCPYEGHVSLDKVVRVAKMLDSFGCYEISLGDTIGVGNPSEISRVLRAVADEVSVKKIAFHGHDTFGMGVANALSAVNEGVRRIDSSVGGLGGCPFGGPNAKGNIATEDIVYAMGVENIVGDIDLNSLVEISWWLSGYTGHEPRSLVAHALIRDK